MNKTNSIPSATVAQPCPACGTPAHLGEVHGEVTCWCNECHDVADFMERDGWESGAVAPEICWNAPDAIRQWNQCVAVFNRYALAQAA